jgi:uncharacterized protein
MLIGVSRIVFHIAANRSLKGKRRVMRRVIERTRAKFNVSVAEVADNDSHRRGVIGIAVVGNDTPHVDAMLGGIVRFIEQIGEVPVLSIETEVIPLKGEIGEAGVRGFDEAWPQLSDFQGEDEENDEEEEEW